MKTIDLLQLIIERNNLKTRDGDTGTAYALWKYMASHYDWTKAAVSYYFSGKSFPDAPQCVHIARELGLDPAYVIAIVEADREKDPVIKAIRQEAAQQLSPENRAHRNYAFDFEAGKYLPLAPGQKTPIRSKRGKPAKVASVILSLGFITALLAPGMDAMQTTDLLGNIERVSFIAAAAAPEECVLC